MQTVLSLHKFVSIKKRFPQNVAKFAVPSPVLCNKPVVVNALVKHLH